MSSTITLSKDAISVVLYGIDPKTIYPEREKNFTEFVLQDGSKSFDVAPNNKRVWIIRHDPPLTSTEDANLTTLCHTHGIITLTEDWVDSGTYTVFFRKLKRELVSPTGVAHYDMEFVEI